MFTGLIEETGKIIKTERNKSGESIYIEAENVVKDIEIGGSISINGACLSIEEFTNNGFRTQAVQETLERTNLSEIRRGNLVNLERALKANSRLEGHFVQGHVDGVGTVVSIENKGNSKVFKIQIPDKLNRYVVEKGSIAINGVSLTIAETNSNIIEISVIPLTLKETNLGNLSKRSKVNVEVDMLAKYVEKMIDPKKGTSEDYKEKLNKWGYNKG